jgi:HK97 family phage portal protein
MSLLSWAGRVFGLRDGSIISLVFGGDNWAGKPVNEANSLNLSAWWRSVKLYADVAGSMPLKFYERNENDDRIQVRDHQVATLIGSDPNADQTSQEFWSAIAASLAMMGNGYAEKRYVGKTLAALDVLPCDTRPDRSRNSDRRLEYRYDDRGKTEWLPADKMFHVRGFTLGRSDEGMSPLAAGRQGLSIALATEEATGKTFAQGLRMSGFFTGQGMKPEQREQFTKTYIDPITGNDAKAHYGILPPGFDFKPINIPPKDAEMLLSRRFNVEEICRFMGVPPIMVGHSADGQTMWGTGVESIINMWLTLGLDSFLTSIEKAISKRLLQPEERRRYYAEFDRNALLRADSAARAEFISKMIQNAQMTPNEGRKKSNLLPMEGGDQLLVNSTLVPLTSAGKEKPAPAPAVPSPKAEPQAISVNVPIMLQARQGMEVTEIEHDKNGRAVRMIKSQKD